MTIYALSSGKGRAGVAVIRLSGEKAGEVLLQLSGLSRRPVPREAKLTWFRDPETSVRLDHGLALYFSAPNSFTGEDVVEFHIHGGRAVVAGLLEALSKFTGVRPAEPGEFTRRAFDNGKMDLTATEALADLLNAETEAQRRQALRQMDGQLGELYDGWRREIISAMAYLEADIDFADEEIPEDVTARVRPIIEKLHVKITDHLADGHRGERIRDGLQVVILGQPNIGKSSLMNYLSRREVAIVSDIEGTTRDVLEVHLDIQGFPVTIIDTAGLRESGDVIEAEGMRRARARAEQADVRIVMTEASAWPEIGTETSAMIDDETIIILNKMDLVPDREELARRIKAAGGNIYPVSLKNGEGLDQFMRGLEQTVAGKMDLAEAPSLTRTRHRQALKDSVDHLERFLTNRTGELELLAEDLRLAARALGRITGAVDVEDILDVVFSEFCIGK
ncbi:tRNA uridine-5-carboxymethylaminomethyl(34) synthesis GTPase MnmE [Emcibacter nanhaiensis]|uniref:tRNA modification GTPase MnmE n=1 Tax=Emcibacter nanhaiensis TaxID=1505037 RepID=A0A501PMC6_9PROT|nr:tRNA uridine-5-carboxymethylaminomethyl(34) synthesis GTPase MnmE [Emcibacter nanhaiensis]TPD61425.1 tRNA uridine-5-carboxymethylaminomethyl(34) synthesis GTPase MnmE [Emcibacter nanhaiensis]